MRCPGLVASDPRRPGAVCGPRPRRAVTYLAFHLAFTLPPLVALALFRRLPAGVSAGRAAGVTAGLAALAFVYTLPWDAYLIARGIWGYPDGRVLATLAGIPVEELAFFAIQTVIAGLWTLRVMQRAGHGAVLPHRGGRAAQVAGGLLGLALTALGVALLAAPRTLYLGLILAWAGPPLAVQWGWGLDRLLGRWRVWALGIAVPAVYLSIADTVAIRDGIWRVAPETSTGWTLGGLPVEEALFFVITSALVVQGILLALDLLARRDASRPETRVGAPRAEGDLAWFAGPPEPDRIRARVEKTVLWPSRIALLALVPFGPWSATWPPVVLAAPFALSLVLFGLPHGAVDPFVLSRRPLGRLSVSAVYFAAALAVLALWAAAPVACAVAFLVLTAVHWGTCDLHTLLAFDGARHLTTRTQRAATAAVRGGLPMLVPLAAAPEAYRRVVGWMAGALGTGSAALGPAEALFRPDVRLALSAGFAALAIATLAVGWRRAGADGQRAWRVDAAETIGLAAFFALVEPLLAVGLYFCLWHAPRHLARLVAWSPPAVARLDARRSVWAGFAVRALPGTLGALAMLAALWLWVGGSASVGTAIGVYLALIAAVTVPHAAVVAWMDRAEGVWATR